MEDAEFWEDMIHEHDAINDLNEFWEDMIHDAINDLNDPEYIAGVNDFDDVFAYQKFCIVAFRTEFEKYERNERIRFEEVSKLISLFLLKGNKMSRLINNTASANRSALVNLQKKYHIKDGESSLGNFSVTLSRISQAYPMISCKIMEKESITRPGMAALKSNNINLPSELCISAAFAVIPKTINDKGRYIKIIKCMLLAQHFDYEIIKAKIPAYKRKNLSEKRRDLLHYSSSAYNSALVANEDRNTYGKELLDKVEDANLIAGSAIFDEIFPDSDSLIKSTFGITN